MRVMYVPKSHGTLLNFQAPMMQGIVNAPGPLSEQ